MLPTRRFCLSNSRKMFVVFVFVSFSLILASTSESNGVDLKKFTKDTNTTELWQLYKTTYNKNYETDEESAKRFDIFAANVKTILDHNEDYDKGLSTYKMGLNAYADYTVEEFRELRGLPSLG